MKRIALAALAAALPLAALPTAAQAEQIGEVSTVHKWLSPDHKIVVEAFDDPKVPGVSCHLSRAKTGGFKGAIGVAEDTSDASIACRQVGPISVNLADLKKDDGQQVFSERISLLFKTMQVVRFVDVKRNTLVYLVYSDRVIEGSPKNAISSVPIMPWR
jgi:CreA protein